MYEFENERKEERDTHTQTKGKREKRW